MLGKIESHKDANLELLHKYFYLTFETDTLVSEGATLTKLSQIRGVLQKLQESESYSDEVKDLVKAMFPVASLNNQRVKDILSILIKKADIQIALSTPKAPNSNYILSQLDDVKSKDKYIKSHNQLLTREFQFASDILAKDPVEVAKDLISKVGHSKDGIESFYRLARVAIIYHNADQSSQKEMDSAASKSKLHVNPTEEKTLPNLFKSLAVKLGLLGDPSIYEVDSSKQQIPDPIQADMCSRYIHYLLMEEPLNVGSIYIVLQVLLDDIAVRSVLTAVQLDGLIQDLDEFAYWCEDQSDDIRLVAYKAKIGLSSQFISISKQVGGTHIFATIRNFEAYVAEHLDWIKSLRTQVAFDKYSDSIITLVNCYTELYSVDSCLLYLEEWVGTAKKEAYNTGVDVIVRLIEKTMRKAVFTGECMRVYSLLGDVLPLIDPRDGATLQSYYMALFLGSIALDDVVMAKVVRPRLGSCVLTKSERSYLKILDAQLASIESKKGNEEYVEELLKNIKVINNPPSLYYLQVLCKKYNLKLPVCVTDKARELVEQKLVVLKSVEQEILANQSVDAHNYLVELSNAYIEHRNTISHLLNIARAGSAYKDNYPSEHDMSYNCEMLALSMSSISKHKVSSDCLKALRKRYRPDKVKSFFTDYMVQAALYDGMYPERFGLLMNEGGKPEFVKKMRQNLSKASDVEVKFLLFFNYYTWLEEVMSRLSNSDDNLNGIQQAIQEMEVCLKELKIKNTSTEQEERELEFIKQSTTIVIESLKFFDNAEARESLSKKVVDIVLLGSFYREDYLKIAGRIKQPSIQGQLTQIAASKGWVEFSSVNAVLHFYKRSTKNIPSSEIKAVVQRAVQQRLEKVEKITQELFSQQIELLEELRKILEFLKKEPESQKDFDIDVEDKLVIIYDKAIRLYVDFCQNIDKDDNLLFNNILFYYTRIYQLSTPCDFTKIVGGVSQVLKNLHVVYDQNANINVASFFAKVSELEQLVANLKIEVARLPEEDLIRFYNINKFVYQDYLKVAQPLSEGYKFEKRAFMVQVMDRMKKAGQKLYPNNQEKHIATQVELLSYSSKACIQDGNLVEAISLLKGFIANYGGLLNQNQENNLRLPMISLYIDLGLYEEVLEELRKLGKPNDQSACDFMSMAGVLAKYYLLQEGSSLVINTKFKQDLDNQLVKEQKYTGTTFRCVLLLSIRLAFCKRYFTGNVNIPNLEGELLSSLEKLQITKGESGRYGEFLDFFIRLCGLDKSTEYQRVLQEVLPSKKSLHDRLLVVENRLLQAQNSKEHSAIKESLTIYINFTVEIAKYDIRELQSVCYSTLKKADSKMVEEILTDGSYPKGLSKKILDQVLPAEDRHTGESDKNKPSEVEQKTPKKTQKELKDERRKGLEEQEQKRKENEEQEKLEKEQEDKKREEQSQRDKERFKEEKLRKQAEKEHKEALRKEKANTKSKAKTEQKEQKQVEKPKEEEKRQAQPLNEIANDNLSKLTSQQQVSDDQEPTETASDHAASPVVSSNEPDINKELDHHQGSINETAVGSKDKPQGSTVEMLMARIAELERINKEQSQALLQAQNTIEEQSKELEEYKRKVGFLQDRSVNHALGESANKCMSVELQRRVDEVVNNNIDLSFDLSYKYGENTYLIGLLNQAYALIEELKRQSSQGRGNAFSYAKSEESLIFVKSSIGNKNANISRAGALVALMAIQYIDSNLAKGNIEDINDAQGYSIKFKIEFEKANKDVRIEALEMFFARIKDGVDYIKQQYTPPQITYEPKGTDSEVRTYNQLFKGKEHRL